MGRPDSEHRQLPLRTTLVEAQNVQIAVVAFDFEIAIVWSVPLIDVFRRFDLARMEPKTHRHRQMMLCISLRFSLLLERILEDA